MYVPAAFRDGAPRVRDDDTWVSQLLDRLVAKYESALPEPWSGDVPGPFRQRMVRAVVGFEMPVERIEGKFKVGQNRPAADQERVERVLAGAADPALRALAALTARHRTRE